MPPLVIAGITIPVAEDGATEMAPEMGGSSSRTYLGRLRSSVPWTKRGWNIRTTFMLTADVNTLRTATANAAQVTCSGDIPGGSITCEVRLGEIPFMNGVSSDALGFFRIVNLTMREV